jgi:hypothetical protein
MYVTLDKAKAHTENIRGLNLAAVTCTTVQVILDCHGSVIYYLQGIHCCTEPRLTKSLDIVYAHEFVW